MHNTNNCLRWSVFMAQVIAATLLTSSTSWLISAGVISCPSLLSRLWISASAPLLRRPSVCLSLSLLLAHLFDFLFFFQVNKFSFHSNLLKAWEEQGRGREISLGKMRIVSAWLIMEARNVANNRRALSSRAVLCFPSSSVIICELTPVLTRREKDKTSLFSLTPMWRNNSTFEDKRERKESFFCNA